MARPGSYIKKGELENDWELVKRNQLGAAFQAFREGGLGDDWELGKEYELVRKDTKREENKEHIAPDLLALMRSFRGLSPEQVGTLMIPFKAQQIFSHIFFHLPEMQLEDAKKIFQDYLSGGIAIEDLEKRLTEEESKGGAGWDHYHAKRLCTGIRKIFDQVNGIDFTDIEKSAATLMDYFMENFKMKLGEMETVKLSEYIKMRLANELAMDEFLDLVDRPVVKGGVGLDHRTAIKVARELEIIMLARYSM